MDQGGSGGKVRKALLAKARKVEPDALAWDRGTFHDFRRTYGTRLARVVPIHVLKEYMGHAKIQTTQEYYLAAETQDGERAREALNTMLSTATAFPRERAHLARNGQEIRGGGRIQKR